MNNNTIANKNEMLTVETLPCEFNGRRDTTLIVFDYA